VVESIEAVTPDANAKQEVIELMDEPVENKEIPEDEGKSQINPLDGVNLDAKINSNLFQDVQRLHRPPQVRTK